LLLLLAIFIGLGSLYYTRKLVDDLAEEEKKKAEIWAQATALIIADFTDENDVMDFLLESTDNREVLDIMFQEMDDIISDRWDENDNDSILKERIAKTRKLLRSSKSRKEISENIKNQRNAMDGFMSQILINNNFIPVIVTNDNDSIVFRRNLKKPDKFTDTAYVKRLIGEMKEEGKMIEIKIPDSSVQYLYYDDSVLLTKLKYFPYFQLGVILLFILVAYLAFSASRNAEQNQVWLGLSKETAHQLGTPTSSLMAWVEILKQKDIEDNAIHELDKDVNRLRKITDRFSKIGSRPKLEGANVIKVLNNALEYIKSRSSNKIKINLKTVENEIQIPLNVELFEWVIENICKNAIDAMEGNGEIDVKITDNTQVIYIDIKDTGRGVPKTKFKTIFKPGYTTKERGWGLGLSLSKRIIENYHNGKIFVHYSEIGKGTRFRIVLKKFF